jgi:pimeloyl-ACP methyl ester carboxylesterase
MLALKHSWRLTLKAGLLAGLITMVTICQPMNSQVPPPHLPPGKMIDVGGYRVHLNCVGAGKPTVMIVGAGYSFDWSLVQSAVLSVARVCTYDPSGSVWSDPGPEPTCEGRIGEIHKMLANAGIDGPLVLVGHSVGAVFARLYASQYPADVSGMVLVDHAGRYLIVSGRGAQPGQVGQRIAMPSQEESLRKLPSVAQDMHRWASTRGASKRGSNIPFFNSCIAEVEKTPTPSKPPMDMPLIVIANTALAGSPDYQRTQTRLLALSRNSKSMVAQTNGHQVPMDDPGVIVEAIRHVVADVRKQATLHQR